MTKTLMAAACTMHLSHAHAATSAPSIQARTGQQPTATQWAKQVNQNANLYRIDSKLYRSEQLTTDDAQLISKLGIKSIINLRYFNRGKNKKAFADHNITLLNRPLLTWNIQPEQIAHVLYLIEQQQKNGAVLVHCYHGADRTGLISGMYRIVFQGWSIEAAKQEMQQGPYGYHSVWRNITKLFTEEAVQEVKNHLNTLRAQNAAPR